MKFLEALREMQENGRKVRLSYWSPNAYIYFDGTDILDEVNDKYEVMPVSFFNKEGWEIYEDPQITYTWQEVVKGLRKRKRFQRKHWRSLYIYRNGWGSILFNEVGYNLHISDFSANDWIEVPHDK